MAIASRVKHKNGLNFMKNAKITVTKSFKGIDLRDGPRIGLWGRAHGGNLSLKNSVTEPVKQAFDALGAQSWKVPSSTPHGGSNYYKTVLGISWDRTKAFFEANDYQFVDGENPEDEGDSDCVGGMAVGAEGATHFDRPTISLGEVLKTGVNIGSLSELFSQRNRFFRHKLGGTQAWPAGRGVYVIRQISTGDSIVYIGMAGRFKRNDDQSVTMQGGVLASRVFRWHPYSFTTTGPYEDHFEYGPNYSVNFLRANPESSRYRHQIPFSDIVVDCFVTDGIEEEVSPAFLESLILQMYIRVFRTLPPANNQF
jgi:hypothetical protein